MQTELNLEKRQDVESKREISRDDVDAIRRKNPG